MVFDYLVLEDPEKLEAQIKYVPEFSELIAACGSKTAMQVVKFMALTTDYRSPYRHLEEKERIAKVSLVVFGDKVPKKQIASEEYRKAKQAYQSLMFDTDFEQYYMILDKDRQIIEYLDELKGATAGDCEAIEKALTTLASINELKKYWRERLVSRIAQEATENNRAGYQTSWMERQYQEERTRRRALATEEINEN